MNIKNILFSNFYGDTEEFVRTSTDNVVDKETGMALDTLLKGLTNAVYDLSLKTFGQNQCFVLNDNQGYHNSIFRGKCLGTAPTAEQIRRIQDGSFYDMFIGDYWLADNTSWVIVDFDYWYGVGTTAFTKHHAVLMPSRSIFKAKLNATSTTDGGILNSTFWTGTGTGTMQQARTIVQDIFGVDSILSHSMQLPGACTNGAYTGLSTVTTDLILPCEQMIFGSKVFSNPQSIGYACGTQSKQLSLFAISNRMINNRYDFWLSDVASNTKYCAYDYSGNLVMVEPTFKLGVRPIFIVG